MICPSSGTSPLGGVEKPYQYVGFEANARRKDFGAASARVALAFPDAYVVGASNVGIQILYHIVNEHPDYMADRAFAPQPDMAAALAAAGEHLSGRESGRPLKDFDLVGFTLQYELGFTNVLWMLDLAGIPRRAKNRGDEDPLVTAGGPCAFNPEPMADFLDFVVVGEGEEVMLEVMAAVAETRGRPRAERLSRLASVKGVYVPSYYEPVYTDAGRLEQLRVLTPGAPERVERRIIKDLDQVPFPTAPVTPSIQPIHERVSVEIQRGCTRSCRFCQAGYVYRPRRERSAPKLLEIIEKSVAATGVMDVGLLSLSSADYTQMQPLMTSLMDRFRGKHLAVSLPSTRLEALREEWLPLLAEERRSGFTIAPEAGSQRLRNVINKNYTEEEVVETARMLFRNGWPHVKMYFMVGLPTETDEDVVAIAQLADEVVRRVADLPGPKKVTVSISNFVPKPHTPFQWHPQQSMAEVARKHKLVRDAVHSRRQVSVKCHEPEFSLVDGLVARGDRRTSRLIERAYENGARFDSWSERLKLKAWEDAAAELKDETGIDFQDEGRRERGVNEVLPWYRISCGLHPRFFKNEYMKAVYGIATEDCSFGACHACGLCTKKNGIAPLIHKEAPIMAPAPAQPAAGPQERQTLRFQYRKVGAGTYLSTLDLGVLLARAFSRAGVPMAYDQGMKSRPDLSLGPALPLGVSSGCELFDAAVETRLTPPEILEKVNAQLPDHLQLLTASPLETRAPGITAVIKAVSYKINIQDLAHHAGIAADEMAVRARALLGKEQILVTRAHKTRTGETRSSLIDLKGTLTALTVDEDALAFTFDAPGGQSVSPYLLVDALAHSSLSSHERRVPVHKTGFFHA